MTLKIQPSCNRYRLFGYGFPTVTTGEGEPSSIEPDGSIYLRVDPTTPSNCLYVSLSGEWTAVMAANQ